MTFTDCRLLQEAEMTSSLCPPTPQPKAFFLTGQETSYPQASHSGPHPVYPLHPEARVSRKPDRPGKQLSHLGPAATPPPTPPPHPRLSPPTSPGSSKIDIHPFLKLSRSGYGERRGQMSQAQQEPKGPWEEGGG